MRRGKRIFGIESWFSGHIEKGFLTGTKMICIQSALRWKPLVRGFYFIFIFLFLFFFRGSGGVGGVQV